MGLAADLHLQLGDSPLKAKKLLLESGFLAFQGSDLLLNSTVLGLLEIKVSFPSLMVFYIYYSMRTSSLERLFFTSAVFIVSTDSRVSFSLLRICTSFLWLLSSLEMFLICCWLVDEVLREFEAFPWAMQGWNRSCFLFDPSINIISKLSFRQLFIIWILIIQLIQAWFT